MAVLCNKRPTACSHAEALSTTTAVALVRVAEAKAFVQPFAHEVQLGAVNVSKAFRVYQHLDAMVFEHLVFVRQFVDEFQHVGQTRATRGFDTHSHSNEILNILEARNIQVFYQNDKNWFYRTEERRWLTLNDNSNWHITENINGEEQESILHLA